MYDIMAAVLKVWRQIENPTPLRHAYLPAEQSFRISSDLIRNDGDY